LSSLCAGLARFFALTPSPSPTLWERGVGAHGGAFPLSRRRERGTQGVRVHRLSSLCVGRARFFALPPSPSPTLWERGVGAPCSAFPLARRRERGVGAHGGAPCSAFPLARLRERGTQGVRATRHACLFTLALGKTAHAAEIPCRTVVPLPDLKKGGDFKPCLHG